MSKQTLDEMLAAMTAEEDRRREARAATDALMREVIRPTLDAICVQGKRAFDKAKVEPLAKGARLILKLPRHPWESTLTIEQTDDGVLAFTFRFEHHAPAQVHVHRHDVIHTEVDAAIVKQAVADLISYTKGTATPG